MRARRVFVATILACMTLGLAARPAGASPPARGCPPAFLGPLTFSQIIAQFPPPPEIPDPEGLLATFDLNEDGSLCVRQHPNGVDIIVIDNVAVRPSEN
jgi:hypothetical protein